MKWVPPGMFHSTCQIDIQWFPFDEQHCKLKFGSWTYDGRFLNLLIEDKYGDTSDFIRNGEWQLIGNNKKLKTLYIFFKLNFMFYLKMFL